MPSNLKLIPYTPDNPSIKTTFLRLLVKPVPKPDRTTSSGLVIPGDIGALCDMGVVCTTCEGSTLSEGDTILYQKMDRRSGEHLDTISIDGEKYDVLFENEVWSVNEQPFNRIFVQDVSQMQVSESGLILPDSAKGVTSSGIVFRAPDHYSVRAGDNVEYRKGERDIYPSIEIDGQRYLCLHESDVFKVNGYVAPYKIIVKIDKAQQAIKRNSVEASKLQRSPLFVGMLHNMQVAEVVEIGRDAQNNFPELHVGDQAILHHRVESEQYRLIGRDFAKADHNVVAFEYRVIDGFAPENRDIFGRIANRVKGIFIPFGKSVFLEWKFEVLEIEPRKIVDQLFVDFDTNIDKCTDIEDLKMTIGHKLSNGLEKADGKRRAILKALSECELPRDDDKYDRLERELKGAEADCHRIKAHDAPDYLLSCKKLGTNKRVIAGYKGLYPINVYGRRFLIGYEDLVLAETSFVTGSEAVI